LAAGGDTGRLFSRGKRLGAEDGVSEEEQEHHGPNYADYEQSSERPLDRAAERQADCGADNQWPGYTTSQGYKLGFCVAIRNAGIHANSASPIATRIQGLKNSFIAGL
jgi:hypothetical protein